LAAWPALIVIGIGNIAISVWRSKMVITIRCSTSVDPSCESST